METLIKNKINIFDSNESFIPISCFENMLIKICKNSEIEITKHDLLKIKLKIQSKLIS
jgi:hypothetical protein